ISWKRFFVIALLLMLGAGVLGKLLPGSWTETEQGSVPARIRHAARDAGRDGVTISIDDNGVRIRSQADAASGASSGASAASSSVDVTPGGVQIKLAPGADLQRARDAIAAIRDERRDALRTRIVRVGDPLPTLAFFFIVLSAILKLSYQGQLRAEVRAAAATEAAESEQLKRQVVEARMAAMQAQVEPHFLFNTLASIDHLIETDPARASRMQKHLIALLRASMPAMRENHPAAHTLGREMAVILPYLEILKVRMEDRLRTEIDVPEGLLSAEFPPMMIQSLVENAIRHGLEPQTDGGRLSVRAEVRHGKLAVTVADTGGGFGRAATAGTGIGLANIRARLQLLYGGQASMTVAENTPHGTRVTLVLPYQAQARDPAADGGATMTPP
ncbi:MAG TPA: histidine kinase, partial [Burkholderiaceae bacterium]